MVNKHIKMFKLTNRGMHIKTTVFHTHQSGKSVSLPDFGENRKKSFSYTADGVYFEMQFSNSRKLKMNISEFPCKVVYVCLYVCLSENKSCNVYGKIYVPNVCCNIVLQCRVGNKVVCSNNGILCILVC